MCFAIAGYKIGCSSNIAARLKVFDRQFPEDSGVIHIIATDDIKALENYWHRQFSHCRLNGEWFALGEKELHTITRHNEMMVDNWGSGWQAVETIFPVITGLEIREYYHEQ